MMNHNASSSVNSAKVTIAIISWIAIFVGIIVLIIGMTVDVAAPGIILIASGITGLIVKPLIEGLRVIVIASEIYIAEHSQDSETSANN